MVRGCPGVVLGDSGRVLGDFCRIFGGPGARKKRSHFRGDKIMTLSGIKYFLQQTKNPSLIHGSSKEKLSLSKNFEQNKKNWAGLAAVDPALGPAAGTGPGKPAPGPESRHWARPGRPGRAGSRKLDAGTGSRKLEAELEAGSRKPEPETFIDFIY